MNFNSDIGGTLLQKSPNVKLDLMENNNE